jgi:hypothetical protein
MTYILQQNSKKNLSNDIQILQRICEPRLFCKGLPVHIYATYHWTCRKLQDETLENICFKPKQNIFKS